MREGRRRRRIGQVVGGHIHSLHRGDGALLGRRDALLQFAHFGGEVRLVSHGRRHAAQQRGNFGARLCEAEDVVNEEQRVGALVVAERLSDRQAGERYAQTRSRRLGHLAVDEGSLGLREVLKVNNAGLLELDPEVVALAGALAHAGKHREATVLGRNVVDQFLDDDSLANPRAAEQTDLAALQEGLDQVNNFDASLEHLFRGRLLIERGCLAVNRHVLLGVHGAKFVYRLAKHVEHTPQRGAAHRNRDRRSRVDRLHAANHAFGGHHRDAAHAAFAQVLLYLDND